MFSLALVPLSNRRDSTLIEGNETFLCVYKGVETSLCSSRFNNLEGKARRESLKMTTLVSGGLGRLQMVLEPVRGTSRSRARPSL